MVETIPCPYCGSSAYSPWAIERGFAAVRCNDCALLYVNPRPSLGSISMAVQTGAHSDENLSVVARRNRFQVGKYQRALGTLFADVWQRETPVAWLDIGAGYGEVVEAVTLLAPVGSSVEGLEPMKPKAEHARARGLNIHEGYLSPAHPKVGFVSLVNVFSHIPNFKDFLAEVRAVLNPGGQLFLETGNLADVADRTEFPGELYLPDHLMFAGEEHVRGYLLRAGFEVVRIEKCRVDGLLLSGKNMVKRLLGRPVHVRLPYTSSYRTLLVRARLT